MRVDVYIANNFYIILHNKQGKCYFLDIQQFINFLRGYKTPLLEGRVQKILKGNCLLGYKFTFFLSITDFDELRITGNTETKKAVIEYSHADNIHNKVTETSLSLVYADLEV